MMLIQNLQNNTQLFFQHLSFRFVQNCGNSLATPQHDTCRRYFLVFLNLSQKISQKCSRLQVTLSLILKKNSLATADLNWKPSCLPKNCVKILRILGKTSASLFLYQVFLLW